MEDFQSKEFHEYHPKMRDASSQWGSASTIARPASQEAGGVAAGTELSYVSPSLAQEFSQIYVTRDRPILITDFNVNAGLAEKWDARYFSSLSPQPLIELGSTNAQRTYISDSTLKVPVAEYLAEPARFAEHYMVGWRYEDDAPQLNADYALPSIQPVDIIDKLPRKLKFNRRWIFMGVAGQCSDLHYDCFRTAAWIMMIRGEKTLRMVSPVYERFIQMGESLFNTAVLDRLTAAGIPVLEFRLRPGTMMYLPASWLHQVRNECDNLMVTGCFAAPHHATTVLPQVRDLVFKDGEAVDLSIRQLISVLRSKSMSPEAQFLLKREMARVESQLRTLAQTKAHLQQLVTSDVGGASHELPEQV